jgi:hypothetical protein
MGEFTSWKTELNTREAAWDLLWDDADEGVEANSWCIIWDHTHDPLWIDIRDHRLNLERALEDHCDHPKNNLRRRS